MKKLSYLLLVLLTSISLWSCDGDDAPGGGQGSDQDVTGSITANTTWEAKNKYLLKGFVYVENGATLTIQPGTIIRGDKATKGALIVKPGGKIIAEGTAQNPIVFTSNEAKGSRATGDWGGIIILGNAPVNKPNAVVEGENTSVFGGANASDNSGVLRYVRIEFAGIAFEPNREINSLTMGGVGSGTTIDYIQVSYAGDDAFEWFGGTVNAKHLISYRTLDDDFDTDNGYSGNVQYGYILRDPNLADAAGDSNTFESDNDASGTTATPQTSAKFANITSVMGAGSTINDKYRSALRIRRNSAIFVYNSLFAGAFKNGLELETPASANNFTNGVSDYTGLTLTGMTTILTSGVNASRFNEAGRKNVTATPVPDLKLNTAYNSLSGTPNSVPQAGSPLLTGGVTLPSGFEANTYVGAFNTTDWTAGWTNFDPQNADY